MPTRNNTADNVNVNIHGIGRSITDWNKIAGMSDETKTGKKKKRKATAYELECAARLEAIAAQCGLGQEAIAEALGISQGAISHYYTGRNPLNVERLVDFSRILGCMPNDIDPEAKIFDLFDSDEMRLFSQVRNVSPATRKAALAYLAGFFAAKSA